MRRLNGCLLLLIGCRDVLESTTSPQTSPVGPTDAARATRSPALPADSTPGTDTQADQQKGGHLNRRSAE